MQIYARRRLSNYIVVGLSLCATGFGLLFLVFVLGTLLVNGIGALSPSLLTQSTPPPGSAGGLLNAVFGSLAMTAIATLIRHRPASSPAPSSPNTPTTAGS